MNLYAWLRRRVKTRPARSAPAPTPLEVALKQIADACEESQARFGRLRERLQEHERKAGAA